MNELPELKRCIKYIVNNFDYVKKELDAKKLQNVKRIVKSDPDYVPYLFDELLYYMQQENSELRYAILLLCDYFFQRSHLFRLILIDSLQKFLLYTAETDPLHYPIPAPREVANALKTETLKLVMKWHEKFSEAYPKLDFAYSYLRSSKSFDFERADCQLQIERSRAEELERRNADKSKRVIHSVTTEFNEWRGDIQRSVDETKRALELLIPRFGLDKDSSSEEICNNNADKAVHGYSLTDTVVVTIPSNASVVAENDDNKAIIGTVNDCLKLLQYYEKLLARWLMKLAKYGGTEAKMITESIVLLKRKVVAEIQRCEELHLPGKSRKIQDSESESDDDMEDVLEKEGLEVDFKPPDEVPAYIMKKIEEDEKREAPGPSSSHGTSNFESSERKTVPVLPYDLDLKYWGEYDVASIDIPRSNIDSHRFWRPTDESAQVMKTDIDMYRARVMTYVGDEKKGRHKCRVPLKDGTLCPRMDFKKCPVHGKIVDRDEMGFPLKPLDETTERENVSRILKDEEDYIRDVEIATGANLSGSKMKRKCNKQTFIEPPTSRQRLSAKLFSRASLKRVCESLDAMQQKQAARNFAHQFNYEM